MVETDGEWSDGTIEEKATHFIFSGDKTSIQFQFYSIKDLQFTSEGLQFNNNKITYKSKSHSINIIMKGMENIGNQFCISFFSAIDPSLGYPIVTLQPSGQDVEKDLFFMTNQNPLDNPLCTINFDNTFSLKLVHQIANASASYNQYLSLQNTPLVFPRICYQEELLENKICSSEDSLILIQSETAVEYSKYFPVCMDSPINVLIHSSVFHHLVALHDMNISIQEVYPLELKVIQSSSSTIVGDYEFSIQNSAKLSIIVPNQQSLAITIFNQLKNGENAPCNVIIQDSMKHQLHYFVSKGC